ncbi:type VI secretion system polymorphic nuclease effector [Aeromonas sp. MR16]|uniref:type VI secretion system polymorphic nuclease effector n=1 Tax=Aeromonas sp. MR16 TaxID=2923420 RepID=UPI001F4B997F|nr:type VI secretion system polymorphic nuclease effector [Aeromonas sp. MR16]MCH7369614.1 type VI secretion system polymorphic nuclease effector [Aeromonas sp. MR16]
MFGNDLFERLYDHLDQAVSGGAAYVKQSADAVKKGIASSLQWIWEALQGDFNPNQSAGQIAANAVLGLIPVVDQVLDCRDLIANARDISRDHKQPEKWIFLCFTLIGLIPSLGSALKGVLKIIFLFVRKAGGDATKAIRPAMAPVLTFLSDPKVKKVLGISRLDTVLKKFAGQIRGLRGQVAVSVLLGYLDDAVSSLTGLISKINGLAPASVKVWLEQSQRMVLQMQSQAGQMLPAAMGPVLKSLDEIAAGLEKEAVKHAPGYKAVPGGTVIHPLPDDVVKVDLQILSRSKKGIYGEIISDNWMANHKFENLLPEHRRVRSLNDKPRGRGIDGIYKNTNPPPPYVVTETKFRTAGGEYIDEDGTKSTQLLSMTKGSGKQMSGQWIDKRLPDEITDKKILKDLKNEGYDAWLMIVDESGKVIQITKLDKSANAVGTISIK